MIFYRRGAEVTLRIVEIFDSARRGLAVKSFIISITGNLG